MASHQDSGVQNRRSSADKIRDLEGNRGEQYDYQSNTPGMSVMPALDSRFPAVQARRKETGISRFRSRTREFWAEFFGTAVLVLFGTAVNHQVTLGGSTNVAPGERGSWTTVSVSSNMRVIFSISGGHVNLNYSRAISLFEGGPHIRTIGKTGGLYFTNSLPYMSNLGCFFNEFLMTAILMMFIVATGDAGNMAPPKGISPFIILWVVFALAATLDIGPRLVTWAAGYGSEVWRIRSGYWFWCATLAPVCGTFVGCFIYDCCIGTDGVESPLHNPNASGFIRRLRGLPPAHETHLGTSSSGNIKNADESD
ncbi:aquaporin-like protein [Melampsora americana]|nr:aquaporin-like protein [Melampsora americana]